MRRQRTLSFILATISVFAVSITTAAQQEKKDKTQEKPKVQGIQYSSREDAIKAQLKAANPLFAGIAVSIDLVGPAMKLLDDYGQYEGAIRINLKNRFFPTAEIGYGVCDYTSDETNLHYKTNAPYFRIGADYNFIKNKVSGNRVYGGLRLAYTSFKYDIDGPAQEDPVWGGSSPFQFYGLDSNFTWLEIVFGLEAKIYKSFHIGWTARYRNRLSQKENDRGNSWYVPGFGKNDTKCWSGTFNLIFDI